MVANVVLVGTLTPLAGYAYVAAVVAFAASLVVARELERNRQARERIEAALRASEAELRYLAEVADWETEEGAYGHMQGTRPQTLAAGLADSPAGLASQRAPPSWPATRGCFSIARR